MRVRYGLAAIWDVCESPGNYRAWRPWGFFFIGGVDER